MVALFTIATSSYFLGAIPFGYLLVRIFRGEDVRRSGSGNIGATNVSRKSPALGLLTLLLDALKGSVAVAVGIIFSPPIFQHVPVTLIPWRVVLPVSLSHDFAISTMTAVLCVLVGHMFPVWLKFRGGKGVATGLGAFVVIAPKAVFAATIIFVAVVLASRYVSLASITAVASFPVIIAGMRSSGVTLLSLGLMSLACLLIVAKHRENIARLRAGTENRIGSGRI